MALASKNSETIHGKTGSDKAKLQANYDDGHLQTFVDLAENGQPELGALILQMEKMQEDIDELRRYIVSNEMLAASAIGSALPLSSKSLATGTLYSDKGIVKIA
tara:strand:- start:144 stop:455 length:312 start_codon:yes stop_codon:yes gene_type:complete